MTATNPLAKRLQWPQDSAFGSTLHKSKIYEKVSPSKRQKALFVDQIDKIIHTSILAPSKVNLPAKNGYREIHIFTLNLRTDELSEEILRIIDKVVLYPTVFVLCLAGKLRYVAAYKRPSESDKDKWVTSSYFKTDWISQDADKEPLPVALDLQGLYNQLIQRLVPLTVRPHEAMEQFIARAEAIRALQDRAEKLQAKIKNKKLQYNRRVEYHAEQRALEQEIRILRHEGY